MERTKISQVSNSNGLNPLKWRRTHLVALFIYIAVGFFVGVLAGFIMHAVAAGAEGSMSFKYWLRYDFGERGFPWGLLGGLVFGAMAYAAKLMREGNK